MTAKTRFLQALISAVLAAAILIAVGPAAAYSTPRSAEYSKQAFSVIKTIDVDYNPVGVTPTPDGRTMWVANAGGVEFLGGQPSNKITLIDSATLKKDPDKITVGYFPEHTAFTRDGKYAAVTNGNDASVSIVDTESRTVIQTVSIASVGLEYPLGVIFSKNDRKLFVTTGGGFPNSIAVLNSRDIHDVRLVGTIPYTGYPGLPALAPHTGKLLVPASPPFFPGPTPEPNLAELLTINPNSTAILSDFAMSVNNAFANDIAVSPDGRFGYISIFAFRGGEGGVWVVDLKRMKTVKIIDTGDPTVWGMGITPDGRYVLATGFTENEVAVIDTKTRSLIKTIPVGEDPNTIGITPNGRKAFVSNQGDTTVSVIALPK